MAQMYPSRPRRGSTSGEVKLFKLFKEYLPDDIMVYHEPIINGNRPDFVLIMPSLGILILEVKDYYETTLVGLTTDTWRIKGNNGDVEIISPHEQAKRYCFSLVKLLDADKELNTKVNGTTRRTYAYNYGVVFTNIDRLGVISTGISEVIPMEKILSKEEVDSKWKHFSEEILHKQLEDMFTVRIPNMERLTTEQIDLIRFTLFPEIRVGSKRKYNEKNLLKMNHFTVMDKYQETLARELGDGPRLIRGPSGSGKTLILIARAKFLSKLNPDWKILILNYNIVLSEKLKEMVDTDEYKNISVMNYHSFLLNNFGSRESDSSRMFINMMEDEFIPTPRWDAILIDEGQDFDSDWLELTVKCLNPKTNSLLLVMDMAQNINRRSGILTSVGIDFRGRSHVLRVAYRSTKEIQEFAWKFFKRFAPEGESDIIVPESTDRLGVSPIVKGFRLYGDEVNWVIDRINSLVRTEICSYEDIAILYRVKQLNKQDYITPLTNSLRDKGIPYEWVSRDYKAKKSYNSESKSVKILTMDSSKGLDFKVVFIVKADVMPLTLEKEVEKEVFLLYVAMTRAQDYLYLTHSGSSVFVKYLMSVASD